LIELLLRQQQAELTELISSEPLNNRPVMTGNGMIALYELVTDLRHHCPAVDCQCMWALIIIVKHQPHLYTFNWRITSHKPECRDDSGQFKVSLFGPSQDTSRNFFTQVQTNSRAPRSKKWNFRTKFLVNFRTILSVSRGSRQRKCTFFCAHES